MSGAVRFEAVLQQGTELLGAVERHLTTGMFGDGAAIAGTAAAYYRGAAQVCARAGGIAPEAVQPTGNPYAESLRRAAVDNALRECTAGRVENGREALERYLEQRERIFADRALVRDGLPENLGDAPKFPDIAGGHWAGEFFLQLFNTTTTVNGAPVDAIPVPASAEVEAARGRAVALARRSVPRLADDVFRAVPRICLYRAAQPYSGYTNAAPLFVFAAEQMFRQDRLAAELLLHECLHQKLNDISVARSLFREDYRDSESARVVVPWSYGSRRLRRFSADRTFAAFHVYTHQTLLHLGTVVSAPGSDEAESVLGDVVLSWARAAHFARALAGGGPILDELGPEGHRLVRWLATAVRDLGEFRLPDGSALSTHTGAFDAP